MIFADLFFLYFFMALCFIAYFICRKTVYRNWVLIVFSMAALAALRWVHTGIQARTGELRDEAAALEHQNSELEEKIGELDSVKSVEDIARSELGLADPNTLILDLQPQS